MTKSNGNVGKKKSASNGAFATDLASAIAIANALKSAIAALGLPGLTAEERTHSDGKLRKGEAAAMTAVFDTMDASPVTFQSLADKDGGTDPNEVETAPARAWLAQSTALAPLGALLTAIQSEVSDAILATASEAKAVSVPAYAIGKVNAASNASLRKSLAPAIDFYGNVGRRKVLENVRQANAAKKTAKAAKNGKPATA